MKPHFFDRFLDFSPKFLSAVIGIMGVMILVEISSRSFLGRTIGPITELCELLLSYIPFLGAAWLLKNEGHSRVDVLFNMLSPKSKHMMMVITSVLGTGISLILVAYGATTAWSLYVRDIHMVSVMREPLWIYIIVIPIGGILLTIQFIRRTLLNWALWRKKEKEAPSVEELAF